MYFDGTESYLVPHAARTFLNSLEFQRRLFDFEPSDEITVLLADFSDSGNAGASVVPRNVVTRADRAAQLRVRDDRRQRAHEHDHEPRAGARGDDGPGGAAGSRVPAALRRQGHPGGRAAGIDALFLSDDAARRGAALVSRRHRGLRRHLDGRRPRPRAERLRRDGVPLDGPGRRAASTIRSGLVSEGTKIDFQRRDQLVPLRHPLHDLARAPLFAREGRRSGCRGATAAAPTTRRSSAQVFGRSLEDAWARLDRRRAHVPAGEPRRDSQVSDRRRTAT